MTAAFMRNNQLNFDEHKTQRSIKNLSRLASEISFPWRKNKTKQIAILANTNSSKIWIIYRCFVQKLVLTGRYHCRRCIHTEVTTSAFTKRLTTLRRWKMTAIIRAVNHILSHVLILADRDQRSTTEVQVRLRKRTTVTRIKVSKYPISI